MNALIFAAGLGTRLQPWTLSHPKAMVPVNGIPMLERVLRKLEASNLIEKAIINVHHFAEQIEEYLERAKFNFEIIISDERSLLLETGGGAVKAIKTLGTTDEPLLIHNADILTDFPLEEMVRYHNISHADATLLCAERKSSRKILFDINDRMRGWMNESNGEIRGVSSLQGLVPKAFGGVHILGQQAQKSLFEYSMKQQSEAFGIMSFYIKECENLKFVSYTPSSPYNWFDIGSPEKLYEAEQKISNKVH